MGQETEEKRNTSRHPGGGLGFPTSLSRPLGPQKLHPHLPSPSTLPLGTLLPRAGGTMGSHWYDSTS